MMATRKRIGLIVAMSVGLVLTLCGVGYFWAIHSLDKSFSRMDVTPIETAIKTGASKVVVIKQPSQDPDVPSKGYLEAYQRDPGASQLDAKFFDAWTSAMRIAEETLKSTATGAWVRSTADASYLPVDHRADPWGHAVCLFRRADTLAVISAGPKANSSPVCRNIQMSEHELVQFPHKKLLESPSGYLILVLDRGGAGLPPVH